MTASGGIFRTIKIKDADPVKAVRLEKKRLFHGVQKAAVLFFKRFQIIDILEKEIDGNITFLGNDHVQTGKVANWNGVAQCFDNKGRSNLCGIQTWKLEMVRFGKHTGEPGLFLIRSLTAFDAANVIPPKVCSSAP